uniref:Truncated ORF100 n=1 Tax=Oryza sativa TaxID=4530 RepID=A0A1D8V9Y9_ORYSA|nr:truncated ORF100 [Oryza sativa]AOX23888.1 truncated ORF100 [Oryza sativa]
MKLYKWIFLYFLRLRPRKARISRYLLFHFSLFTISYSCY